MKKLLLLGVIAIFSFNAFSQTQLGLKFGYNSSKITTAYITDENKDFIQDFYKDYTASQSGFNIGFVYTNTTDGVFSFQQEIVFSQRGYEDLDLDKGHAGYSRFNYIDIKPLFNFGGGSDNWRVYAQVGPSVNIWMSKKSYDKDDKFIEKSDEWDSATADEDGANDIRVSLGLVLGGGFKYKLGPGWALINPRYELGFTPVTIVDTGSKGYAIVNRTFSINLGYLYEF